MSFYSTSPADPWWKLATKISTTSNNFAANFTDSGFHPSSRQYDELSRTNLQFDILFVNSFDDDCILKSFKAIKNNLSSGPDGIPGVVVRDFFPFSKPLKHIFNLVLMQSSCFPDAWKISRMCVAILNNFCKLFEFCLYKPMVEHVKHRLSEHQHGFMPGRSTVTNSL